MIEELVKDYSNYVKVDLKSELHDVQDTIDDMLTRLDEFENLVNMVKADNELSSDLSIPMVIQSKQKLDLLCRQVDSLEIFINRVKSDMEIIETQVQEAEEEMGQPNGRIKSMIKPLLRMSNSVPVQRQSHTSSYQAPTLFKTSSFFPPQNNEDTVQNEQKS
ncbi:hypothetical protein RUM44_009853 [Polyplax serrata]|uniref:Biogenesis of lysosome-related organelles complex 1 subunit 4 n=1 Tax=Polyplax serrata TaxID=468196 RepID=A0ABR1ATW3_POLSC